MPEWRDEYFEYKKLKKMIKHLTSDDPDDDVPPPNQINKIFQDELFEELQKVESFFIKQSDETVKRAENIIRQLEELINGNSSSDSITSMSTDGGKLYLV